MGRWTGLQALERGISVLHAFVDLFCPKAWHKFQHGLLCRNEPARDHISRTIWAAASHRRRVHAVFERSKVFYARMGIAIIVFEAMEKGRFGAGPWSARQIPQMHRAYVDPRVPEDIYVGRLHVSLGRH